MNLDIATGLIDQARFIESPNYDAREQHDLPECLILHSISLPPGDYQTDAVIDFFSNRLDPKAHPYFESIAHLTVSSHFFIRRDGELIQFVPTSQRAWHAGESMCFGKPKVNDFSIGIELEGLDEGQDGYTDAQYQALLELKSALEQAYPNIKSSDCFAHSDIAPGRKIDPGAMFDWSRVLNNE